MVGMDDVRCEVCKKQFKRKKSQVLLAKKHYCSVECQNLDRKKGKIIECNVCSKRVYKKNKDIINSKNGKFFCSIYCSNKWLGNKNRGQNHTNWINGKSSYKEILKRVDMPRVCNLCGERDERVLIVHHIDHNRDNNSIINLVWLCCNCHFLVHNHPTKLKKLDVKLDIK